MEFIYLLSSKIENNIKILKNKIEKKRVKSVSKQKIRPYSLQELIQKH
jgi:hypothetical protein